MSRRVRSRASDRSDSQPGHESWQSITTGMNQAVFLRIVRRLGIKVSHIRRTGEMRLSAPGWGSVKFNARRKDTPREVTSFVRRYLRGCHRKQAERKQR